MDSPTASSSSRTVQTANQMDASLQPTGISGGTSSLEQSVGDLNPDPWKSKTVLTLDGGGVRGYGSLLILRYLMVEIKRLEESYEDGDAHSSSYHPSPRPLLGGEQPSNLNRTALTDLGLDGGKQIAPNLAPTRSRKNPFKRRPVTAGSDKEQKARLRPSWDGYCPCHYFDYIGGTSTGGLNAMMLGRLRMTVDQCIENYSNMASNIFSSPRYQIKGWPKAKHDGDRLKREILKVVEARLERDGKTPKDTWEKFLSPEDLCKTIVVAKVEGHDRVSESLYIFRSYKIRSTGNTQSDPKSPDRAIDSYIWEVGRATSAALTFFDAIEIGGEYYSDGGIGHNNPSEDVYYEVLDKEKGCCEDPSSYASKKHLELFLSIGTGGEDALGDRGSDVGEGKKRRHRMRRSIINHLRDLGRRLSGHATDVQEVDKKMRRLQADNNFQYYRWTGGKQLAGLVMDKWVPRKGSKNSTEEMIENWVADYMKTPGRQKEIRDVAKLLVQRRRQRCTDEDKWPRFSHCTQLRCPWCEQKALAMHNTRAELVAHCRKEHKEDAPPDLEELINSLPLQWPHIDGGPY